MKETVSIKDCSVTFISTRPQLSKGSIQLKNFLLYFSVPARSLGLKLSYEICIILFDARKDHRIDFFWARSDIYVVNFEKSVFIEGVIFHNLCNNIKCVVWYRDSRFQRFLLISSYFDINFQVWNLFYLVKKTSIQLLFKTEEERSIETYIKWKAWGSSFRKI